MSLNFWFVASATSPEGREATYALLKSRLEAYKLIEAAAVFDVPKSIKFGRLDDLMRMSDELVKQDTFIEQACRRLEKVGLEIDPNAEFKVLWQRNTFTADQYLSRFIWDEAKYPNSRSLKQNVDLIVGGVAKLDEEIRVKTSLFSELKAGSQANTRPESAALIVRDLIDVLTPDICQAEDFIDTEHLKTIVAVVPKTEIASFPTMYWKWSDKVVPKSHKEYPITDKDGSTIFTFLLFKSVLQEVKDQAKTHRVTLREFTFSPTAHKIKTEERTKMEVEKQKQESVISRICLAAFSECFVAWVHLKAVRIFVECVLRYGVPPDFSAFVLQLPPKVKEAKLRKELEDILCSSRMIGRSYFGGAQSAPTGEDEGDFYPYVSMEIVPFLQFVQK